MAKKIRVAILFGGKSAEHEVSLRSAKNVFDALDRKKYEPVLIGIDKTGKWLLSPSTSSGQADQANFLLNAADPKLVKLNKATAKSVALIPQSNGELTNLSDNRMSGIDPHTKRGVLGATAKGNSPRSGVGVDVVFPILHGPFGEDGTVQGLLKLANVPFVGAGVLGSAVGMDKDIAKRLLRDAGIPIGNFIACTVANLPDFKTAVKELGLPMFIKPANLGSSVGISKVKNAADYKKAVKEAFQYDSKIMIEEFIKGREIECAVLGNEDPKASVPGEVIPTHEFYSYDAKYLDENGARLEIPAKLPSAIVKKIQALAVQTFKVLGCEGLGRVDFFLKDSGEALVNEINTIPGFTSISMYPKMWEATGIGYSELIDRLIQLAIERFKKEQKLKSNV